MVGIVIVSHSHQIATGVVELARQAVHNQVTIAAAGGVNDHTLGTNAERIYQAIQQVYSTDGVLILYDLGSAILSTQIAIEMFSAEQSNNILLSSAPLVEGAVAAALEASLGHNLETVRLAAEKSQVGKTSL